MKKILLSTLLASAFCAPAFAQSLQDGYLTDSSGNVVKSGFGLCWKASSSKKFSEDCGDKKLEEKKKEEPVINESPLPPKEEEKVIESKPVSLTVNTKVLFKFDSSVLTNEAKQELDKALSNANVLSVHIVGHTDSFGTEKYNEKLGMKRAQAVKDYLVSKQVPSSIIKLESAGETQLVVNCKPNTIACQAPNRRAQIDLELQK